MNLLQSKQSPSMFRDGFIAKYKKKTKTKKTLCSIYSIVKSKEPLSIYISLWADEQPLDT